MNIDNASMFKIRKMGLLCFSNHCNLNIVGRTTGEVASLISWRVWFDSTTRYMAKAAHKAQKKKRDRFNKEYPDGHKAFSLAKRKLGIKRGTPTNHSVVIPLVKSANVPR